MSALFSPSLPEQRPAVLGITGGIAAGKSAVTSRLRERGAAVIDADSVGHQVLSPGAAAYGPVLEAFGREVLASDGSIDRRKLGARVFAEPAQLRRLNAISHPLMAERMEAEIARLRSLPMESRPPLIVLDAAILLEAGWDSLCDAVWTVEAPPELALRRLMLRNGLDAAAAQARLDAQMSNAERARRAQRVIVNAGTLEELRHKVDVLWPLALQAAAQPAKRN